MQLKAKQYVLADIDLTAELTQQQAEQIDDLGREAVVFALLQLTQRSVDQKINQFAGCYCC